jgi:hypothetical protein
MVGVEHDVFRYLEKSPPEIPAGIGLTGRSR